MFKKISCSLLAVLILCCFTVAVGASSGSIYVSNVSGVPGDTVSVEIIMNSNPGVSFLELSVEYDESCLKLVNAIDEGVLGSIAVFDTVSKNPFKLSWSNEETNSDFKGTGTIATLTFKIVGSAKTGKTNINLSCNKSATMDIDHNKVDFSLEDGSVTVSKTPESTTIADRTTVIDSGNNTTNHNNNATTTKGSATTTKKNSSTTVTQNSDGTATTRKDSSSSTTKRGDEAVTTARDSEKPVTSVTVDSNYNEDYVVTDAEGNSIKVQEHVIATDKSGEELTDKEGNNITLTTVEGAEDLSAGSRTDGKANTKTIVIICVLAVALIVAAAVVFSRKRK